MMLNGKSIYNVKTSTLKDIFSLDTEASKTGLQPYTGMFGNYVKERSKVGIGQPKTRKINIKYNKKSNLFYFEADGKLGTLLTPLIAIGLVYPRNPREYNENIYRLRVVFYDSSDHSNSDGTYLRFIDFAYSNEDVGKI